MEIGSEFWIDDDILIEDCNDLPPWLSRFGDVVLTTSGRGALSTILDQVKPKVKNVLLPSYICDSVILPFEKAGYELKYYDVDDNFMPIDMDSIENSNPGMFLHMGYFGFNTNAALHSTIRELKQAGVLIVEDITHTLFSAYTRSSCNDYFLASLRKWFGIPSGGVLASTHPFNVEKKSIHEAFVSTRATALQRKAEYLARPTQALKAEFAELFGKAETLLNTDVSVYSIDAMSYDIISHIDVNLLTHKRRENYTFLFDRLKECKGLAFLGPSLDEQTCPFFFPILVREDRNRLQVMLAKKGIYCPSHWPAPINLPEKELLLSQSLFDGELSIPCDQRYGLREMEYIVNEIAATLSC